MSTSSPANTYLWCDACRRSFSHDDAPDALCLVCGSEMRELGRWAAITRGLMANELVASDIGTKHRQLIRLIWTRNGMGKRYYRALGVEMPYPKFEARVTELLMRGAADGWVRFVLPSAPSSDDTAYRVEFDSEERFVDELANLFR